MPVYFKLLDKINDETKQYIKLEKYDINDDEILVVLDKLESAPVYILSKKELKICSLLYAMTFDDPDFKFDKNPIPINGATDQTSFELICVFLNHYSNNLPQNENDLIENDFPILPKPLDGRIEDIHMSDWYKDFLFKHILSQEIQNIVEPDKIVCLQNTTILANFLNIKPLVELLCATIASIIKEKKSPEQLRYIFTLDDDFTDEEKKQNEQEINNMQSK